MWIEDYHWHYDYVRLAWDAGFSFEKCKFPDLDKNKICLVDIDRIIKERDVATVDRYVTLVVQYILDNDQAKVLDTNFVKMFRISQLSVEYLLFCKQYLDNTVVLLKKEMAKLKDENKELKSFNAELEAHINSLTKNETIVTFKCSICPKVFSSEEYLNAHIKRRHDNNNNSAETNKLQMEIKELKERLNNTEKLLQDKKEKEKQIEVKEVDENEIKLSEIQLKFEQFKEQVEGELKILQVQKSFYEEKYGKLFDIVINKETASEKNIEKLENTPEIPKINSLTQTDIKQKPELKMEILHNKNTFNFKESTDSISNNNVSENKIDFTQEINSKMNKFEETIETKVSATLESIEGKMQAFWNKLSEIEIQNKETNNSKEILNPVLIDSRPVIKPRTKFSQLSKIPVKNDEQTKKIKAELDLLTKVNKTEVKIIAPSKSAQLSDSECSRNEIDDDLETESESEIAKPKSAPKPSMSTLGKHSITSIKNVAANENVKLVLSKQIDSIVKSRLQEMGISPLWKGLPKKTYEKAMEIIKHQATLTKKTYPNFYKVKQRIELSVNKEHAKRETTTKVNIKNKNATKPLAPKQNIVSIKFKEKPTNKIRIKSSPSRKVVINKSFYETDTESEILAKVPETNDLKPYSDVINELKSKIDKKTSHQEKIEENDQNNKGVLKNFPSMGSLAKKKVNFDVKKSSSNEDLPKIMQVTSGSTTSVGSSVLDNKEKKKHSENIKNVEIVDDISDFEFNDI